MKRQALCLLSLSSLPLLALAGAARADLAWEHKLSVRLGASASAKPIGAITMRNQWQATTEDPNVAARQRFMLSASAKDFDKLPPLPFGLPGGSNRAGDDDIPDDVEAWAQKFLPGGPVPLRALFPEAPLLTMAARALSNGAKAQVKRPNEPVSVALVTDFASDRFLSYVTSQRTTLGGPLRPTLERVRFDPWKKIAPRLSEDKPEALTRAQRARLGAEVRSLYRPFQSQALKLYFRPLAETRTINGMEARGYRLAILTNVGGQGGQYSSPPEWAQVRAEMWMAPEQDGDAIVRSFNRQARDLRRGVGGETASMWLNEFYPVLWQMMPQEILQMAEAIAPPEGSANEGFGGTPVLMHLTFTPPPIQRMAIGETRLDLTLVSRSTEAIAAGDFQAPAGYKAEPLEPLLKKYDKSIADLNAEFDKAKPKPKAKPKAKAAAKAGAKPKAKPAAKAKPTAQRPPNVEATVDVDAQAGAQ